METKKENLKSLLDKKGELKELTVDLLIGADGANSRVAKAMDAGDYKVAIAFQERIKLPKEEMGYYEDLAEMYVGTDVSLMFLQIFMGGYFLNMIMLQLALEPCKRISH